MNNNINNAVPMQAQNMQVQGNQMGQFIPNNQTIAGQTMVTQPAAVQNMTPQVAATQTIPVIPEVPVQNQIPVQNQVPVQQEMVQLSQQNSNVAPIPMNPVPSTSTMNLTKEKESMQYIGEIEDIKDNNVFVNITADVKTLGNLMNTYVIFEDPEKQLVGEILNVNKSQMKIGIVGEMINGRFLPGINKKPSFAASVRKILLKELSLILGDQEIKDHNQICLGLSTVYTDYRINVGINDFFSNHFAILGNTGSGKSCTLTRLIQNVFTSGQYLPLNANIFIFDAYGEYSSAFSNLSQIDPRLNYKVYTTNTLYPDTEVLKIPLWLLDVDDIALLLGAQEPNQLPIIEKTLKLVPILKGDSKDVIACKNDIIARALLDILKSGKEAAKIRDQITGVLTTFHTDDLHLDSIIYQTGYDRTLRQCIYVDNNGKLQEMELAVGFLQTFLLEDFELPTPDGTVSYTLKDLEDALNFALISEGILKSDKVFDYANILSVRLHSIANGQAAQYFEYDKMVSKSGYIADLLTTFDNKKAQIVNFNINYVDDRLAKTLTKIISKLIFDFAAESKERGGIPFHIIIEEAHRYVQNDNDSALLGYNIFDRITKEGRKYGVLLGLITQRPSELSETSISQCSNFLILRTLHPKDLTYIREMVPNVSDEIVANLKTLQPGNAIAFGSAFRVPVAVKMERPNPEPYSSNSNVAKIWYGE